MEKTLKSHYLEDYEDSSKTKGKLDDDMIGSFRICLSKKKIFLKENIKIILNYFLLLEALYLY